jgi:AcrR family transcriptional regulator
MVGELRVNGQIRIFDYSSKKVEMPTMSKPRAVTIQREAAILNAAQKRFAHYGISKVTMDEVAADVGLKKASLYYYFRTKEDLFRAVVEREEKGYLAALQEIRTAATSPPEKLHRFGAERLELFGSLLNLAQFKIDSWTAMRPAFQELFRKLESEEHRFLTGILSDGTKQGVFCVNDPRRVATLFLHVLHGLRLRVVQKSQTPSSAVENYAELQQEVKQLFSLLLRGIANGKRHINTSRNVRR